MVLSTRLTLLMKIVGSALPLLIGWFAISAVHGSNDKMYTLLGMVFALVAAIFLGLVLNLLATVYADEFNLRVRLLWHDIIIPFDTIIRVKSHHFLSMGVVTLPLVTVTFRASNGRERRFRFIAKFTLRGWEHGVHPDVAFLKTKAGTV